MGNVLLFSVLAALLGCAFAVFIRAKRRYRNESVPKEYDDPVEPQDSAAAEEEASPERSASFNACVEELDFELGELGKLAERLETAVVTSAPVDEQEPFLAGDDTVLVDLEGVASIADEIVRNNDQRRAELEQALMSEGDCPDWEQESREQVSLIEDLADIHEPAPDLPVAPDDLKRIRGIGKVFEGILNEKGIQTFEQLASLSLDDIEALSEGLSNFGNRVARDQWVEQAQALVAQQR